MRHILGMLRGSKKTLATISVILILSGLGYHMYKQWQKIEGFQQQIQGLPLEKRVELEKDRLTLENTAIGTLVQAFGGLLLFVTAYVSFQNLKTTQKIVLVAEEKQVTERFTQAIAHLESEGMTVRCGGIYALERIAKDSPKDHWTIVEVLTSFIKERLPLKAIEPIDPINTDVQAAITVIRRRNAEYELPNQHIDLNATNLSLANLRGADLSKADLSLANLRGADLSKADLSGAILIKADLSGADLNLVNLRGADLSGAILIEAIFSGADLIKTILIKTDLRGADLSGADLIEADLSGADLSGADLSEAILSRAILSGADLSKTDFTGADLSGADLNTTDLSGAILSGAILIEAILREADLIEADLSEADLRGADLSGADLSGTNLSGTNLSEAILNEAILVKTNLSGTDLSGTDLSGTNLSTTDLRGADLSGTNLSTTDLSGATKLTDVQLKSAKLCKTHLPADCNLDSDRDCKELGIEA
jgi:uncharacterized protein YjbI with pentapeptide repeats